MSAIWILGLVVLGLVVLGFLGVAVMATFPFIQRRIARSIGASQAASSQPAAERSRGAVFSAHWFPQRRIDAGPN